MKYKIPFTTPNSFFVGDDDDSSKTVRVSYLEFDSEAPEVKRIIDSLYEIVHNYVKESGNEADYILMGASEYLHFSSYVSAMQRYMTGQHFILVHPEEFMGKQIIVTNGTGISLGFKDNKKAAVRIESKRFMESK